MMHCVNCGNRVNLFNLTKWMKIVKVNVREVEVHVLNWLVAQCRHKEKRHSYGEPVFTAKTKRVYETEGLRHAGVIYTPSTDPKQAYTIIYHEKISIVFRKANDYWLATCDVGCDALPKPRYATGPDPLIAAMRCYVISKMGEVVDVPEELSE